ncbi:Gfo/Idh/MocA family oxidoreductase [Coprothermobacteraceae bacterium]|nr:Gfo/Idh/MocA family oxidoreductase [Coprothermobacteraceae bacterium]
MAADVIRVGIIGCGSIAFAKHMPFLSRIDGVELAGFYNPTEEKALKAKAEYGSVGSRVYKHWQEMLEDPNIDIVHVLTPNKYHAEISIAALEAGKHVMCEKPMATNATDARKMVETARRVGRKLSVSYQNRFRPEVMHLKRLADEGTFGWIYFARAQAVRRRGVPTWGHFLDKEMQGGGALIDIGTHALDLTLWIMNNYSVKMVLGSTYAEIAKHKEAANPWGPWDPEHFNVEESAFAMILMEDGATVFIEASWALNTLNVGEARTEICGTKAGADLAHGLRINGEEFGHLFVRNIDTQLTGADYYEPTHVDPGQLEMESWIQAIREDKEPVVQPEQAMVVTEIIDAVYRSAASGRAVTFPLHEI